MRVFVMCVASYLVLSTSGLVFGAFSGAKIYNVKERIDYPYRFRESSTNFIGEHHVVTGVARNWTVLVNFHGDMPLNLSSELDPFKRTISWAVPFSYTFHKIKKVSDIHGSLALPRAWSGNHYRLMVSFVLIPPGVRCVFKMGYATPQVDDESGELRRGGGVQMRLRYVPRGAVVVSVPVFGEQDRSTKRALKETRTINVAGALKRAMNNLNTELPASFKGQHHPPLDEQMILHNNTKKPENPTTKFMGDFIESFYINHLNKTKIYVVNENGDRVQ